MKVDVRRVKTYSIKQRRSKVEKNAFAKPCVKAGSFQAFYDSLPRILKAKDFKAVVDAIVAAKKKGRAVIFMMGAHVIKCGLSPLVIDLIQKKIITTVVFNGAGIIHDFEIAYQGKTSEDVGEALKDGSFGMGKETAEFLNNAVNEGVKRGLGIGSSVVSAIAKERLKYKEQSILYCCYKENIPVCVQVAIGTDIIHQHPSFSGAAAGEGSQRDFLALVKSIAKLGNGGVVLNFGSSVILPEVFLKALNLARNIGHAVYNFTSANFDMIYHYRPAVNVVSRPTQDSGKGYYIIGHHEIMLPLLHRAVIGRM
ncbi:MAG: hypothetical protein A2Y00_09135 [Omnitrophica WOR_2 bacterium GWF2_43_52]|nr:MAG: hypothetical protein A2Y01_00835 [Omnitrophica WOR_2 bacterium GWC2_44_8]OGX21924.1 MAG: hypothetical protein A2Y00_09135 [Omnitrophica WOR_2 bacterium GWF2_43_52]HAH20068.1 hypothetical protein [Candidatus Omnitrophota bacterium]HBG63109.1 hypothetical protein [Candidatus Omnitrophota bacterium]HCD37669.1 hypothetical protein [Candidatus Omnitrophota bacterium]